MKSVFLKSVFTCEKCGTRKTFEEIVKDRHMLIYGGEKGYFCPGCGRFVRMN